MWYAGEIFKRYNMSLYVNSFENWINLAVECQNLDGTPTVEYSQILIVNNENGYRNWSMIFTPLICWFQIQMWWSCLMLHFEHYFDWQRPSSYDKYAGALASGSVDTQPTITIITSLCYTYIS